MHYASGAANGGSQPKRPCEVMAPECDAVCPVGGSPRRTKPQGLRRLLSVQDRRPAGDQLRFPRQPRLRHRIPEFEYSE